MSGRVSTHAGDIRISCCGVDDDYVLDWCPWRELPDMAMDADRPASPFFRFFNQCLQEAYRGHAVAAWDGTVLVGIATFFPEGAVRPPEGWEYPRPCALSPSSCKAFAHNLDLQVDTSVLMMGCVSVHTGSPKYRRLGVASAMIAGVLDWAYPRGYRLVKAYARQDGGSEDDWYRSPDPEALFWRRAGFRETGVLADGKVEMVHDLAVLHDDSPVGTWRT